MKRRVLSSILLVPFLAAIYFGGLLLVLCGLLLALLGIRELAQGFSKMGVSINRFIGYGAAVFLYGGGFFIRGVELYLFWVVLVIFSGLLSMFFQKKWKPIDAMVTVAGTLYVVLFSHFLVMIDRSALPLFLWLVLLAAFGTDIFAYFTGFFFGKRKLSPTISPKKTVEGAIGGVAGSVLLCGLFGFLFVPHLWIAAAAIGLIGSVAAQFGDLTASLLKRNMGIKDFGNLIPGHGGVLDRFDSILFTAPFVYYCIVFISSIL